jgi:hypothetical protein
MRDLEYRSVMEPPTADHRTLSGYAALFNTPAYLRQLETWEQIAPGAFTRSIAENDIALLAHHDTKLILGRTSSKTLILREDLRGLQVQAHLPDTSAARDVAQLIERRDLTGMSFGFLPRPGGVKWERKDGKEMRTITDADLREISIVTFPVYAGTELALRSRDAYDKQQAIRQRFEGLRAHMEGGTA